MSKLRDKFSGEEKTVAKNYGALVVLQGLNYLLPLLVIPFLERTLGLENFGLVMFAQAMMVFCLVITDFGFNYTATREVADLRLQNKDFSNLYFTVFWAKMVLTILTFLLLITVVFSFEKFRINWELYLLSFGVVVGQSLFPLWFFQGIEKMKLVTITNVVAKVIFVVLIFLFVRDSGDFLKVPIFNSIGFITAGVISFAISLRLVKWRRPNFSSGFYFYKQSFQAFVANSATTLYTSANVFFLGIFGGDVLVGVFVSFEKIILAAKNVFTPIYQALLPYLSRLNNIERVAIVKKLLLTVTLIGFLITIALNLFATEILDFLFKDPLIIKYIVFFRLMSWVSLFSGLSMLYMVLYAPIYKLFKSIMTTSIFVGLVSLICCLLFIPNYTIKASAGIMFFTELLLCVIALFLLTKKLKAQNIST